MNTTYGVFSAYYQQNNHFEGGSTFRYAWVGGLSVATALACGPLANLLCRVFGLRVPMVIGTFALSSSDMVLAIWMTLSAERQYQEARS